MTPEEARKEIHRIYKDFNPRKGTTRHIEFLLSKYRGQERALVKAVRSKYTKTNSQRKASLCDCLNFWRTDSRQEDEIPLAEEVVV